MVTVDSFLVKQINLQIYQTKSFLICMSKVFISKLIQISLLLQKQKEISLYWLKKTSIRIYTNRFTKTKAQQVNR